MSDSVIDDEPADLPSKSPQSVGLTLNDVFFLKMTGLENVAHLELEYRHLNPIP